MPKILLPFSFLYSFLSQVDRKLTKKHELPKPVISVGNITWGGSGKTPIVIDLANLLLQQGLRVAVLTRGFGRKSKEAFLISDPNKFLTQEVGDEPLLIAKSAPGAMVVVGANRYANALRFSKESQADVYILDDGFQHWAIKRNMDIVCINAANPFGNGYIIPAGILRQSLKSLRKAQIIVITNTNLVAPERLNILKAKIANFANCPILESYYGGYEIKTIDLLENVDKDFFKGKKIFALSGIGFNKGFNETLKNAGFAVSDYFCLKDHQSYNQKLLREFFEKSAGGIIITTAKDAVKISEILED
ncbi:MAG: tetraacyldisaccharide 4'-kinase, partial [Elusimicrobiota bacterium]|nr:tetraacyldisaccharide 4'-kinase [Elusimicrobiota bacterium]